jgi:hypothetical protein
MPKDYLLAPIEVEILFVFFVKSPSPETSGCAQGDKNKKIETESGKMVSK